MGFTFWSWQLSAQNSYNLMMDPNYTGDLVFLTCTKLWSKTSCTECQQLSPRSPGPQQWWGTCSTKISEPPFMTCPAFYIPICKLALEYIQRTTAMGNINVSFLNWYSIKTFKNLMEFKNMGHNGLLLNYSFLRLLIVAQIALLILKCIVVIIQSYTFPVH